MTKEPGSILHLVDKHRGRVSIKKKIGLVVGHLGCAWDIKGHISVVGKKLLEQRRLPGLSRAGETYRGKMCG
jgi:hypothetical protein